MSSGSSELPDNVRAVNSVQTEGQITLDLPVPKVALAVARTRHVGCGATLAKWASAGLASCTLVLTDGSKGAWTRADIALSWPRVRGATRGSACARRWERGLLRLARRELRNGVREQWKWPAGSAWSDLTRNRPRPLRRYRLHPTTETLDSS